MLRGSWCPYSMDRKFLVFLTILVAFFNLVLSDNTKPKINCPTTNSISEDSKVGDFLFSCSATDQDDNTTANGTIGYNFFTGNQARKFSVDAATCRVYLAQPLEYSSGKTYTLVFGATDGGGASDSCTYTVNIIDVNNNAPSCTPSLVWGSQYENTTSGSKIAQLNCSDKDTGTGGNISYIVFLGSSSNSRSDTIGVDAKGLVFNNRIIDYDAETDTFQAYILVSDGGSPVLSTTVTVILSLLDLDDNAPKLSSSNYTFDVNEHASLGYTVGRIDATDIDQPNTPRSQITLKSICTPDLLMVDRSSGDLFVTKDINWNSVKVINCIITASSVNSTTSTATVTVTVKDINDGVPVFNQTFYTSSVEENTPPGTTFTYVAAVDPEQSPIKFLMNSPFFNVGLTNGAVSVNSTIDYETQTSYLVTITAVDSGSPPLTATVYLQVSVIPENEFDPEFTFKNCSGSVAENSPPGTPIFTVSARDNDTGRDGEITYNFVNTNQPFFIDTSSGLVGVESNIDFEKAESYTFTVYVKDMSNTTVRSATQTCTVTVIDENDQSVECSPTPVTVVQYPFPLQQKVALVNCTGPKNANLTFAITAGNNGSTFKINPTTGEVILDSIPIHQQYNLNVSVTSGADITTTTLIVFAEQELKMTNLPATLNIKENQPGGIIFNVEACCAFPQVVFQFVSGNNDQRVTISNGLVTLNVPYNREFQAQYNYLVRARSDSRQTANATLIVNVVDVNDNAPAFANYVVERNIEETLPTPSTIDTCSASDKDEGINAEVTYAITSGNDDNTFAINNIGVLSLVKSLNYQKQDTYKLEITATDKGSPTLAGTMVYIVHVVDKHQSQPQFVPAGSNFLSELEENIALGTTVFVLQANDTRSTFRYDIVSGDTDGVFLIDPETGVIRTKDFLDRERTPIYSLNVSATNQNGVSIYGTLTINVTDINDNYPIFSTSVTVVRIADQTPAGYLVASLNVTDADLGVNGTVTLSVDPGYAASAFQINGYNLETIVAMDYTKVNWYRVLITAADGGNPKRTTKAMVDVFVLNGQIPYFSISSATISVREGRNSGVEIYDLNATAKGAEENGSIKYTISSGNTNSDLLVMPNTGAVIVRNDFDFERTENYALVISAANPTTSNPAVSFALTINVVNDNEADPVFDQYSRTFTVEENAAPNKIVGTIVAKDTDKGPFGKVTLTFTGSSDFILDPTTGDIKLRAALDYLVKQYYTYNVTACDGGAPPRCATASAVIQVNDVNNHKPIFTSDKTVNVLDSVPIGSKIYHANANDLDSGDAGNVSYEIVNPSSQNTFTLDKQTGILKTNERLDALTISSYKLTLKAFDAGLPSLYNTMDLVINVIQTDPNYFDPVFTTTCSTSVPIPRNSPVGTTVLDCPATDQDKGVSGELGYTIISGNGDGFFSIDYNSGVLTTVAYLQPAKNSYSLGIQARDKGKPPRSATMTLDVDITPAIAKDLKVDYNFTIEENVPVGTLVGTIIVDDGRTVTSYVFSSGNYKNTFTVDMDGNNGKLVTMGNPDRELYPLFALDITIMSDVEDENVFVEVYITDVNDIPPQFTVSTLKLEVAECSPVGQTVATLTYSDLDTDAANRKNTLSIQKPGSAYFSVDQAGHLIITTVPDYETKSSDTFNVIAVEQQPDSHTGNTYRTATVSVAVDIINVEETEERSTSDVTEDAYISLEAPYQASVGHVVYTLKPGDFGLIPSNSATYRYISYKSTSPISVQESTGDIKVSGSLGLWTNYFMWVMIQISDGGITTSRTVLLRVDTFDMASQMAVIEFADSYSYMTYHLKQFLYRAQEFFPDTQRIGVCNLVDTSTSSRRRLLALKTAAYTYVVNNTSADQMTNVNEPKYFMSEAQILKVLQYNPDGTPVAGLSDPSVAAVETVEPYEEKKTSDDFDDFVKTPAGIAVFTLLALLLLVLLLLLLTCIFYRKCYNKGSKTKKAKDKDIPTKRTKKSSFSRVDDPTSIFNSNPNIIVSAPPPLSHQALPTEKPPPEADNSPAVTTNPSNQYSKNQNNEAVKNGLPSQYNGKGGKNKPGKMKIFNISK